MGALIIVYWGGGGGGGRGWGGGGWHHSSRMLRFHHQLFHVLSVLCSYTYDDTALSLCVVQHLYVDFVVDYIIIDYNIIKHTSAMIAYMPKFKHNKITKKIRIQG